MKNLYKSIINSKIILIISNKCTNKNLTSWNRIESEESIGLLYESRDID